MLEALLNWLYCGSVVLFQESVQLHDCCFYHRVILGKPTRSDPDEASANSPGRQGCAVAATVKLRYSLYNYSI